MKHHLSDTHPLQPIRVKLTMEQIQSTGLIEHCDLVLRQHAGGCRFRLSMQPNELCNALPHRLCAPRSGEREKHEKHSRNNYPGAA